MPSRPRLGDTARRILAAMTVLFVARSAALAKWASDVGLSKHVYKVGVAEEPLKPVLAAGWCGETDWTLVKKADAEAVDEEAAIGRLAVKERMIDPNLYPRLKGTRGVFKVAPQHVENHILVGRALAGESELKELKLKPTDFADYLIKNALK
jgi:hypothetical protein